MAPCVSLALPVYNGEAFIAETISSILDQDYQDFELIITDNASTDGTEGICREFATRDGRIGYVRNDRNLGAGPNFNKGFDLTSGKYFKWCACDDRISANFLARCVSALETNQDAVLAYGATQSIDHEGHCIPLVGSMIPSLEGLGPLRRFQRIVVERSTLYEIFGLFRREALEQTTRHRTYYGSDHPLIAELALLGRFVHVPDATFYNREHPARSINLDKNARIAWQYNDAKTKYSFEYLRHLLHLVEIAVHRRKIAPLIRTLPIIFLAELRPIQLIRYTLEIVGVVSPAGRIWLRETGWKVLRKAGIRLR